MIVRAREADKCSPPRLYLVDGFTENIPIMFSPGNAGFFCPVALGVRFIERHGIYPSGITGAVTAAREKVRSCAVTHVCFPFGACVGRHTGIHDRFYARSWRNSPAQPAVLFPHIGHH